jgi:ubiquinone/menaquinone biosynthesis C-methylase UbiE
MSIRDAYSNWSSSYDTDRNLTRDLDHEVMQKTFTGQRYHKILEAGCGTGKNTGFLAAIADHVLALDFSEGMITQARAKVAQENVTFQLADLTQPWPCEENSVDLVVCNLVLEHIRDLAPIFAQVRRVLVDGGQFFSCELHPFLQYEGKKATFKRGEQQIEIEAFIHHLSEFTNAAEANDLKIAALREWWHADDEPLRPPRLVSFIFSR